MDVDFTPEEQNIYEKLYKLIGAKIRFTCDGYLQEGIILTIKPEGRRVMIKNVYFILPNEKVFSGTLRYRFSDLTQFEVVATAKEVCPYTKNEYIENLIKNSDDIGKKYSLNDLFFGGLLSEESDEEEEIEEDFLFDAPRHLEKKIPRESVVLDSIDFEWKQAMKHINLQKTIGASFHGFKVSRLGKLSWLCISTSWCVFFIDIQKMGASAFDSGLRSIFENVRIKKIIHDCRFASDCLAHQFNTRLENVFDTLIADFVISMQRYNDKYKYEFVQSLNHCLRFYLDVLPEYTYTLDRGIVKDTYEGFSKRPLDNMLRSVLMKDTIYLLLLHEKLSELLLEPLHRNVDRYLRLISDSCQYSLDYVGDLISNPVYIPPACLMNGIQTVQFRKPKKKGPISLECRFIDPKTGKFINTKKYSCKSSNLDCDNGSSKDLPKRESNKENGTSTVKCGRPHHSYIQENKRSIEIRSNQLEEQSTSVGKTILKPSGRHMDEIYHKLVNNQNFDSRNAETIVNIKPPEKYVSKFTMRVPLQCVAFSKTSCDSVGDRKVDATSSSPDIAVEKTCNTVTDFPDYSDTWAKLRACKEAPRASIGKTKYKFIPAGMSC